MAEANVPSGAVENAAGTPPDIPGHTLLRRIGRGSYGEVWLAQTAQGEYRAAKIVYRNSFERERPFEREYSGIQKFEPVSRSHPSQVSILQVGRNDAAGYFYYVMELADDDSRNDSTASSQLNPDTYKPRTLRSEVAALRRIPYDRALDISLALTKALEHLHQHGLIHRDIKPSNIIFVDGVPKLADIGLVTDIGASISYVGTEGFLPPEGPISQQADIYSLGKVLYELSTGQDRMEFPELPTFLGDPTEQSGLLELNLVFLKACQNDPAKRYRTAREMSADLALLRSGKSLKRARAVEKRLANVTRAFMVSGIAAALIAGGYYAWNRHRVGKLENEVATRNRERLAAQQAARDQTRRLVNTYLANAELAAQGDATAALAWLAAALKEETEPSLRAAHEQGMRKALERFPKLIGFFVHPGGIASANFSDDATRVVTAGRDSTVRIWDVASGRSICKPLQHKSALRYAELSSDNGRMLSICEDGSAWLWRLSEDETVAFEMEHDARVLAGEFSPDGRFAILWGESKRVTVLDGLSARVRFKLEHDAPVAHARYSPDNRIIAVASGSTLTFWDAERGGRQVQAASTDGQLLRLAFSPDSRRVVAVTANAARLCNASDGEWAAFGLQDPAGISVADFTADGRVIVTTSAQGSIRMWHAANGTPTGTQWHFTGSHDLAMSPDASAFVYVSTNRVSLTDLKSHKPITPPAPHRAGVRSAALSADARLLLSAGIDGAVWLSEVFSGLNVNGPPGLAADGLLASARLLSGRELSSNEQLADVAPDRLAADWQKLKTNVAHAPTPPARWHLARAERLFSDALWFGVRFHTERLGKLGVVEERLREWDGEAARQLARMDEPAPPVDPIPPRAPDAPANLIDLGRFYNAGLATTWLPTNHSGLSNDLSRLPVGTQNFNGVSFDVRGLIQLSSSALENLGATFPKHVAGIPINRQATNIHFLHGAAWDALYGVVIGKYIVNYASGEKREAKIVFGKNVRDWWFPRTQPQFVLEAAVAWEGYNPASRHLGMAIRVFQYRWTNPLPDEKITSIDFVSTMEKPAPFLLAITTEPAD